jgi:hypothetical protein
MAAMTRTGTNASESATQLRAILMSLTKPTQQSEEALAEFGLSAEGLRATIQEDGLWVALQQIKDAVGDNDEAMARIFPNIRALAGVLDLTGANADETAAIFAELTDVTGATNEAFEVWGDTTEAKMAQARSSIEALKIELGQNFLPVVGEAADKFNWLLTETDYLSHALHGMGLQVLAPKRGTDELADSTETAAKATAEGRRQTEAYVDWMIRRGEVDDDVAGSTDNVRRNTEALTEAIQEHLDWTRRSIDPVYNMQKALEDVTSAQTHYNEVLDDNESTQEDVARAAMDLARAVGDAEAAALDGDLSFSEFSRRLADWERQGLISSEVADTLRGSVKGTREEAERYQGDYHANLHVSDKASATINRVAGLLGKLPREITTTLRMQAYATESYNRAVAATRNPGSIQRLHAGGMVERFHSGGHVGWGHMRADEVPAILQTGEYVLSRRQFAAMSEVFSNVSKSSASTSPGGGLTVHQTFAGDVSRGTLVEARHQQRLAYLESR